MPSAVDPHAPGSPADAPSERPVGLEVASEGGSGTPDQPAIASDFGLPRPLRLRARRDFTRLQRVGVRASAGAIAVLLRRTAPDRGRFGLTVSKKVGKAVVRNRTKRRLREILRHEKAWFAGRELVVIAQPGAGELPLEALRQDLERALARAEAALASPKASGGKNGGNRPRPRGPKKKR